MKTTAQTIHISNAQLLDSEGNTRLTNATIVGGHFVELAGPAEMKDGSLIIDAKGCLLIPGLHDHHTHLIAYAASLVSVDCGPPDISSEAGLISALSAPPALPTLSAPPTPPTLPTLSAPPTPPTLREQPDPHWLRGTGYHESVHPHLNRQWLDTWAPDRPIRIQHRSGRLWILNSPAMKIIQEAAASLARHERDRLNSTDGRLFDVDELLGKLTRSDAPPVSQASQQLAAFGVTGINDMTPSNNPEAWQWFSQRQVSRELLQKVRLSGRPELSHCQQTPRLSVGETKVHLHDSSLPDFDEFVTTITFSHRKQRCVAVHCVTEVELVFTLAAFRAAGTLPGDRIEHASVIPPALIEQLNELRLSVVTQPNFVYERGDAYLKDIPQDQHAFLYRTGTLMQAGIPTAFGTDLPFGQPDPWEAMKSATKRITFDGNQLNEAECVTPEAALNGFLGELAAPSSVRSIKNGVPADCCLMDVPWEVLRCDLSSDHVRMTMCDGEVIYTRD